MKKINTPHDKYFRTMLSNKDVAKDFLEWHLPDFIKKRVDLDTIEAKKDSFVDDNFKKLETDILFSVKFGGHDGYVYTLVEAQKKPERLMPLRLMKYLIAIMEFHFKETKDQRMPVIYPLILYKSKPSWNHSTNFFDLFLEPDLAKQILTNDFQLVDIHRIPDEEFNKHFWSGVFEACIKWGASRDIINTLESLEPRLIEVFNLNKGAFVAMLTYLGNVGNADVEQLIEWGKNLSSEIGEEMKTLAKDLEQIGIEKGFERGEEHGIQKGVEKTALKMIKKKVDNKTIKEFTDLSDDAINALKAQNQEEY